MTDMARFGPLVSAEGVTFRLWAPAAKALTSSVVARRGP